MSDATPSNDPLEALASPVERQEPRPSFARTLRARLLTELGLDDEPPPTIDLPRRRPMSTATPTTTRAVITPYLTSSDAAAAIDWYRDAFGAEEAFRVVSDDGIVGHAELTIAGARFMLSDEHPDLGVRSPRSLGGPSTAFHLDVDDVDELFARAVAAGATVLQEPADQPHGARHGTILDPDGHRWMLSQQLEQLTVDEYADRSSGSGYEVVAATGAQGSARDRGSGSVWASVFYRDAPAGIRFLTEVLGFDEQLVVTDPEGSDNVVHSQFVWPEGGIVSAGTYHPDNIYNVAPGDQRLYIVASDPRPIYDRCVAAGLEVVQEPYTPDYDPDGMGFGIKDPEGNIWSVGTYAGDV